MVKWWQIYNLYKLTYRIFQHLWTIYLIILSPWFDRDISIKLKKLLNLPDFPTPLSPTTRIFMSFPLWWPPFGSLESSITGFGSLSRWYGKGIRHPQSGANLYNIFFSLFPRITSAYTLIKQFHWNSSPIVYPFRYIKQIFSTKRLLKHQDTFFSNWTNGNSLF